MSIPTIKEQIRFAIMNDNDEKATKLAKMFGYNEDKHIPSNIASLIFALRKKELYEKLEEFTEFSFNEKDFVKIGNYVPFDKMDWVYRQLIKCQDKTPLNKFIFGTWDNNSIPLEHKRTEFVDLSFEVLEKYYCVKMMSCLKDLQIHWN